MRKLSKALVVVAVVVVSKAASSPRNPSDLHSEVLLRAWASNANLSVLSLIVIKLGGK